ncbi:7533_t:CDS:2 [Dentiscutata erythropus]|uniref:7533_t:CDS:1 n=1 Tax=Dentiscutata erythropus TaxID=1348616 RepID=A0A9N9FSL1_9GLOM|nr:7533_t:CDS:2 [Dentiscutata erythropus]
MNQKYLIGLHIFFFLILAEKIYGCHPRGIGCSAEGGKNFCGAQILDVNLLSDSTLTITVVGGSVDGHENSIPHALGHLYIHDDTGNSWEFLTDPIFVNGHMCTHDDPSQQKDTFTYSSQFGFKTPPDGTWFDIWVSVYWDCDTRFFSAISCRITTSNGTTLNGNVYIFDTINYVWVTKINSTIPSTTTSISTTATRNTTTTTSSPTQTIINSQPSSNNVNYGLIIGISIGAGALGIAILSFIGILIYKIRLQRSAIQTPGKHQ